MSTAPRLRVDAIACDGVGMCGMRGTATGRLIRFDSWGFPIVPDRPLGPAELPAAGSAVAACPRNALFLDHA